MCIYIYIYTHACRWAEPRTEPLAIRVTNRRIAGAVGQHLCRSWSHLIFEAERHPGFDAMFFVYAKDMSSKILFAATQGDVPPPDIRIVDPEIA